jgi:putative membrane protein
MRRLVLNVDRDDDFGRKAKIKSPIIGIKNNIDAATKFGQSDPEDSDLNAIYYAISIYNQLKSEKKDVEIATICGHINVGMKSDEIIAKQLEEVIEKTKVDNVVLVSDGAEDEYILPIIESRIKINSVNRVSVKQSKELEDTYYRILKILDDEKVQKQFILPIALVLIVWAFFVLLGLAASGFGAILLTLGLYLLVRVFRWERKLERMWEDIKSGFLTGKLSIPAYILAFVVLIAFVFIAYYNTDLSMEAQHLQILSFINNVIWGFVIAGIIAVFGRAVDTHVKDQKTPWNYWVAPFSFLALGFIVYAVSGALYKALITPESFNIEPFYSITFIGFTVAGIMMALIGAITYRYIKETHPIEESEIEQKATIVENN